ncbi:MAG: hypothetical protein IJ823_02785 [Bacteroidales bacterium]|nr:hypothetical protein [Bacteroidales bacterium]
MKTIWQYIAIAALAVSAAACTPEYPEPKASGLPQASDLDVNITVDQTTNYVTFVMNNKGVVPVWIFGDQKIDGKTSKKYSYTDNNVRLRFRDAGEYTVEVKAYNANGISTGSLVKTFNLENTYRDPFDPSPYINAISGGSSQDWVWNNTEDGHFGCGPVGNPLGWWSCGANGKAGFLYDDVMTFSADGSYTFTSEDGMAYANTGSEYMSEYNTGEDYLFPAETKTTKYTFENSWNDAGIEEIYLVLQSGSILSYVPHKSAVEEPRFQVLETKTANMKKKLQLMSTVYTPNNTDGISWYYEFVPKGSVVGAADPLYGYESKIWVLDSDKQGYMGCGPDAGNPTGWWNAAPHDKDAFSLNDDEITFFANGKYVYDPGENGMTYCNWESGWNPDGYYSGDGSTDYDAPAERQESTYTLGSDANGDYIELPAGILFTYVPRPEVLTQPTKLYIKENTAEKLVLVPYFEGIIAWQLIFKPKDGQDFGPVEPEVPEETTPLDPTFYDVNGEGNLWKGASLDTEMWYSPGDWSGGLTPDFEITAGNGITVTIPDGVGGSEWMGQTKLKSHIASSADKEYDFSVTLLADEDMTVTIKLTNDPEEDNDIHSFFYDGSVQLTAGEPFTYRRHNLTQSVSGDNVMLIFDFGRSPVGSTIQATDILFQEHRDGNLWAGATIVPDLWYSPGDWSGGLTPEYTINADNGITVTIPDGVGGGEWMGQTKLKSGIVTSNEKTYAFSVKLTADEDMTVTIKLTNDPEGDGDPYAFFYDGGVQLSAGETLLYVKHGLTQKESGDNVMLIFDFGRSPVGSTITASDIIFIEE